MRRPSLVTLGVTALAVVASTVTPLASAPAPASAAVTTPVLSVSSTHEAGYPRGRQHAGVGSSASISAATLTGGVTMTGTESKAGAGDSVTVSVQPPQGQRLAIGRYSIDSRVQDATRARVEMSVGSLSEGFVGDVEVLDLAADATGKLTRFDIVFRNGTESPAYAYFGQLRLGQAGDTGAVLSATTVQYPGTPIGSVPTSATETIFNTSTAPLSVGTAAVTTGSTTDFRISDDTCSNTTLAAGARCTFKIGFVPTKAGPRQGIVTVRVGATTKQISLAGSAPLGTTGITYKGDDYVSGGTTHSFPDGSFTTVLGSNASDGYSFVPLRPYGLDTGADTTRVDVVRYGGGPLAIGTFDTSEDTGPAPDSTAKYGLAVRGSGRGCGSYTGKLTVSAFDVDSAGVLTSARMSWTLRCTFSDGTMTGSLNWRNRADKAAPRAVTSLGVAAAASGTRTATWRASTSTDNRETFVRLVPGTVKGATPTSGLPVTVTSTTSARLPALITGKRYTLVAWSVDTAGNLGPRVALPVTG
ncbi:hypothetical protein ES689_02965 [Frigoribacterium sp. ACAM 257]|uniref:hypothetical protein n=1 Tax=Frigoribacterium sp. ACAM 257 TaxID=2508998 RepID=UPI0011B994DF|nr:hypothetical protein [Frigoribacterium sp. ACAM 257]TWX40434.1 hypothetical protein ES689_02965 [Frigoribacterium sp. ACAM 257]